MRSSFWHMLWSRSPVPSWGQDLRGGRHLSSRPRLELLEHRLAPACPPPLGSAGGKPPGDAAQIQVTVEQDSAETVIDLGAAFDATSGIQHGGGLKLSIVGNTNSGLVTTDLSEGALTLTYSEGMYGTATITVGATDADGVSVTQTLVVTVHSANPPRLVLVGPIPAGLAAPTPAPPSR
jgi:hypothetical protein